LTPAARTTHRARHHHHHMHPCRSVSRSTCTCVQLPLCAGSPVRPRLPCQRPPNAANATLHSPWHNSNTLMVVAATVAPLELRARMLTCLKQSLRCLRLVKSAASPKHWQGGHRGSHVLMGVHNRLVWLRLERHVFGFNRLNLEAQVTMVAVVLLMLVLLELLGVTLKARDCPATTKTTNKSRPGIGIFGSSLSRLARHSLPHRRHAPWQQTHRGCPACCVTHVTSSSSWVNAIRRCRTCAWLQPLSCVCMRVRACPCVCVPC